MFPSYADKLKNFLAGISQGAKNFVGGAAQQIAQPVTTFGQGLSSFIQQNPTPASYFIPRIADTLASNVQGTVSPLPTNPIQNPWGAALNTAAQTIRQVGSELPDIGTSMLRVSPPGQLYTQAKGAVFPNLQAQIQKQRLADVYNAAKGIGYLPLPQFVAANAIGGAINVGMQGVRNKFEGKPFLENYDTSFARGYSAAAPFNVFAPGAGIVGKQLPVVGKFIQEANGPLRISRAVSGTGGALLKRAAGGASENALAGILSGVTRPLEQGETRQQAIAKDAAFGALLGGVSRGVFDLGRLSAEGISQRYKVGLNTAKLWFSHVNNIPIKFLDENGQQVSMPLGEYNRKYGQTGFVNLGAKVINPKAVPEATKTPTAAEIEQGGTSGYMVDLVKKQDEARQGEKLGLGTKISQFYAKLKEQLVNAQAPIEDILTSAEKRGKFVVRPTADIRLQIDRSLRSSQLAGQFVKDNGLADIIRKAPDLNALDQYMIAKQARAVAENGIETGRDLGKDAKLIQDLAPVYEPLAQQVNQYSRKLLQYSVNSGLISQDTANMLIAKYPEYVPLNRIFSENELATQVFRGTGKGVASLSKQTVVQRLQGSERQIENPIASLVQKTKVAFDQGERNIAAQQLASYKDLPGNPFNITEVQQGEAGAKMTFSSLIDGVKHIYQTTPEVAAAAKSLNKEQMGLLAKIVSIPTRLLRLGATGLNYPFAIANLIKDQSTAFVNTKNVKATSLLNPIAFTKGLFAAVGHGKLYEDLVRNAGGGTSWDIGRENPNITVGEIRAGRNLFGKAFNVIKNPIRSAEDLIGRTEELTRAQQYHGMYDALIKQGRTPQDARLLAAQAARENTVNFARGGTFSRVLNWVIPYFNAGVQGSRTLVRNLSTNPVGTMSKFAIGVGMPVAAATAWNLSDPLRKQAYQDIPDFEKQNSIVIVPPNPTKNEDGTWNVWKIPLSQEIASLTSLIRRPMEQAAQLDPVKFGEIANALFQTGTSLNTQSPTGLFSSLTPQAVKPAIEAITNTNLFTGRKIVPEAMRNLPPEQQIKKNTSGTARLIGKATNLSPLIVQNEAQTILGGLGPQLMSLADSILNKFGAIPANQVSQKGFGSAIKRRFLLAQGGEVQNKMDEQLKKGLSPKETQAYDLIHTPQQVNEQGNPVPDSSILNSQQKAVLYLNYQNLQAIDAIKEQQKPNHDPIWDLSPQWRNVVFASRVQLPGQKNTYDKYLGQQPWFNDFMTKQSEYFKSLPSQPQQQVGGMSYPEPSSYVQQQMYAKNWNDPQVKAWLNANTAYKNQQLAALGLPLLTDNSGYTTKRFPPSVKKLKAAKMTNLKLKTAKKVTLKLSNLKYRPIKPFRLKNNSSIKLKRR